MPICKKCEKVFPNKIKVDGKWRNLQNRARCIDCQPFLTKIKKKKSICEYCKVSFIKKEKEQRFCSMSCSASSNNIGVRRHGKSNLDCFCINCGKAVGKNSSKYCSSQCMQDFAFEKKYSQYLMCEMSFGIVVLKRILVDLYNNKCQECGIDSWNGKKIVLDIEHIDGNSNNNKFLNLSLLCQNCHAQTSTYKGKNKGNGRHSRRKRYKDGKSY